jgi:transcriptional regulator with XRE-family HTH domain
MDAPTPTHLRLAAARRDAGLTQAAVADRAAIDAATVSRVEHGDPRYLTPRNLLRLARALDVHVSIDELFGRVDTMKKGRRAGAPGTTADALKST